MAEQLSDGTISWIGGMDTSRSPSDIDDAQYSMGCNVIIPDSLGGVSVRFGLHCTQLIFDRKETEEIYRNGRIQGEGWFVVNGRTYLICLVNGYVLRFTKRTTRCFYVENTNSQDPNLNTISNGWVIQVPGGCIINNGFDNPIYVTDLNSRRTDPRKGEIGIGQMGIYMQHRLFYVDQSGTRILASDFMQPLRFTREDTNIFGFMAPDKEETITAIGKQKSIIGTVEGGNLIWSTNKDIYSVDVRGTRSEWANLGTKIGKTTETVPGFSATSSYSFESYNTNIYFRSKQFGISDIKQSQYQFVNLDSLGSQSIEAAYYLNNDTKWMLDRCYTRACNKRLYTTVAPERTEDGHVFWNGLLSFHPAALYNNVGTTPRRFESIFTGVRPWCLTVATTDNSKEELFIHSYDKDGVNRFYVMDEDSNHDIDQFGNIVEIQGYIETKAYSFKAPFLLKNAERRFYRLGQLDRTTKIILFSRPEPQGEWIKMWEMDHLVCRTVIKDEVFYPTPSKPQTRPFTNVTSEKYSPCYSLGNKFMSMQYRIEFTGPVNFDSLIVIGNAVEHEKTVTQQETECITLSYDYRPDYSYSITKISV